MKTRTQAQPAIDRFLELKAEIDGLLAALAGASADHFAADPEAVNWGHVGSLSLVAEKLHEACDHLGLGKP